MNSRERVIRALEFRNPDRAPRDLGVLSYVRLFRKGELDEVLAKYPTDICGCTILARGDRTRPSAAAASACTPQHGSSRRTRARISTAFATSAGVCGARSR